jgi:hypothetical protein
MTIEDDVRRTLHSPAGAPDGWPDPVRRIETGIRRRRRERRQLAALAVVAIAVLLTPAVVWVSSPGQGASGPADNDTVPGVVPYLDRTVAAPTYFARNDPRPTKRPCQGEDFGAGGDGPNPLWGDDKPLATTPNPGTEVRQSALINSRTGECTLSGSAKLRGTDPVTSQSVMLSANAGTSIDGGIKLYPATIANQPAQIDIVTSTSCRTATPYRDVELVFADRAYPVPWLIVSPGCTIHIGDWYSLPQFVNVPLDAWIDAPATVHRGETLRYSVTLLNSMGMTPALDPCPVYKQSLATTTQWMQLNCVLRRLPAHTPVTFQMQLPVPADAPLGRTKLEWIVVFSSGQVRYASEDTNGATVEILE